MKSIYIQCLDCQHINRNELGMPGFELLQTRFETFDEAHRHASEKPNHVMIFGIDNGESDD